MAKKPREVLRDLRTRAGLQASEVARALGYKSTSGYLNYEYEVQGDRLIPAHLISKLIPVFSSRGTPPITRDELVAISDARALQTAPSDQQVSAAGNVVQLRQSPSSFLLTIRYRVEPGHYMELSALGAASYGESPLVATVDVDPGAQFAVAVMSGEKREVLHCVTPHQVVAASRAGRRCLVSIPRRGDQDLVELAIVRITEAGEAERGTMLGIVIGSYVRE